MTTTAPMLSRFEQASALRELIDQYGRDWNVSSQEAADEVMGRSRYGVLAGSYGYGGRGRP